MKNSYQSAFQTLIGTAMGMVTACGGIAGLGILALIAAVICCLTPILGR